MKLALLATLPLMLSAPADASQKPRPAAPAATTATVTVTDLSGTPLSEARVVLTGSLDRSGSTAANGTVKFDGLRPGTYRLRFEKDGFVLFERELEVRAGQPPPNPSVALSPAPQVDQPPPPAPEPAKPAPLPPPGKALTVNVPDFLERNFITNTQPQKVSEVGCSGLAHTVLWQVREPWEDRTHENSDVMLYVVGGEGSVRIGATDLAVRAGSFAQIPRSTSYSITRRGRNPIILLATLVGEPCQE